MGGITECFVQLGIQKQKGGAGKAAFTLNVYTNVYSLNADLLFLQIHIARSNANNCSKGSAATLFPMGSSYKS